jgi:hypothetical protein
MVAKQQKSDDHTLPVLPHFSSDSIVADILIARLRHMPDPEEKGPDGTTLKDRFSGLMQSIAKDITSCGSACDVYMKRGFLGISPPERHRMRSFRTP